MKRSALMKANYHTHTTRCRHASGTDEAYVQAAVQAGFDILGFADHTPWPYQTGYVSPIRMDMDDLPGYVESVKGLRAQYKGRITVLLGLECEYFPKYMDWLRDAVEAYGLDYLIFGAHYIGSEEDSPYVGYACRDNAFMNRYADMCVAGMQTGLYAYLAHPDIYMRRRDAWDAESQAVAKTICACALERGMPLEYNLNGHVLKDAANGFPCREFWEVAAAMGNKVVIGYDAHQPELFSLKEVEKEIAAWLNSLGLHPLDSIPLPAAVRNI